MDKTGLVDAEPVLRHFGARKKRAVETYIRFVESNLADQSQDEYYRAAEGRLLGSEEFLKEISHRIGDHRSVSRTRERTSIEDLRVEITDYRLQITEFRLQGSGFGGHAFVFRLSLAS